MIQGLHIVHRQAILGSSVPGGRGMPDEQQTQCDPNTAIPLHYQPLHEQNRSVAHAPCQPPDVNMPSSTGLSTFTLKDPEVLNADDWCPVLKVLMIKKASVLCFKLAKEKLNAGLFGSALNLARQALYCFGEIDMFHLFYC